MKCLEPSLLLSILLLCLELVWTVNKEDDDRGGGGATIQTTHNLESWQTCNLFLAPSSTGWGVFAARDYREGEHVDAAPLIIRTWDDRHDGVTKGTVLDDYVYGYVDETTGKYSPLVLFGYSMFFNHHPEPNVAYYRVGSGSFHHTMGFKARGAIQAGEQMFSTYGEGEAGREWFQLRGMEMMAPKESSIAPPEALPDWTRDYCSNIYAGFGYPFWERALANQVTDDYGINASHLAPFDAGFGNARAKRFLAPGERIEIGPGLILSSKWIAGSALASLVFAWHHLTEEQQANIRTLRERGQLKLQHQGYNTQWERRDIFETWEDLAILPVSGQMGLVRRVGRGDNSSNCQLNILLDHGQPDSVTVIMELVATQAIDAGELLLLNSPWSGTHQELELLRVELHDLGQPHYEGIFDSLVSGTNKPMEEL